MQNKLPHSNTYWVEPGRLMAGEYPGSPDPDVTRARLREYLACGVDAFVDLTTVHDRLTRYDDLVQEEARLTGRAAEYHRFPVPDQGIPESPAVMTEILDMIDTLIARGRCVYVHCWGGIGRTGTVVGCWLVRRGASGGDALETLAELWKTVGKYKRRPQSPETDEQLQFVREWMENPAAR